MRIRDPRTRRDENLRRRYGISVDDYEARLAEQDGCCAICDRPASHVDHDHDTGAVRGLLCFTCNAGLGNLRDDPDLLRRAAIYLEEARKT